MLQLRRARKAAPYVASVLALAIMVPQQAVADILPSCPGALQDHNDNLYHFETASTIEPLEDGNFHYVIKPCIHNEQGYSMAYWWLFPQLKGSLPKHVAIDFDFSAITNNITQVPTCLLYGGAGDTDRAWLKVEQANLAEAEKDTKVDCAKRFVQFTISPQIHIQNLHKTFFNFFPSRKSDPDASMLQFNAIVGIEAKDKNYVSFVSYQMFPYEGSRGKAEDITFSPNFSGAAGALTGVFEKTYGDRVRGAPKGDIRLSIDDVPTGKFTYTAYDIHDATGEVVGSIPIPVFLPTR